MHVIALIKRWFAAPDLADDRKGTRTAGLLNQAIVISLLLAGLFFIGAVIGHNVPVGAKLIALMWFSVLLLSWRLLRGGKVIFVAFTLTVLFFAFLTSVNISLGTIRTPTAAIYVFWVIHGLKC